MGAVDPISADDAPTGDAAGPTQTAVVDFRCDNCGGPVTAEPGADKLTCGHCGHSQPIARKDGRVVEYDFQAALRDAPRGAAAELSTGAREVECKGCGARTVTTIQSGVCSFCGSPLIADLKAGEKLMLPESLLPHKVTRDQAKAGFQRWLRSRWFAPNDLARRAKTAGLDGVMLPHWTYDSNTSTSYVGLRGDYYYVTVSYTDSKGNSRTRTERRTRWRPASGTVFVAFDDVLVCASRSLPAKLVQELEPWDLEALQPFDPAYLAGHVTERYTIDLAAGFDLAADRMRPRIRSAIERDIGGDVQQILSMDVTHRNVKFKHLLLPLWISSFRYRERVFRVMVNARTGEVQGERPWSWIKILLFTLFIAALIGGGVWLYQRAKQSDAAHDRIDEPAPYEPTFTPDVPPDLPDVPVLPDLPPEPAPALPDPLGQLAAIRTRARQDLRDAALVGITFAAVDATGQARGAAVFRFVSPSGARRHQPCATALTFDLDGLHGQDEIDTDGCAAPLLTPPTCALAEVMARIPAGRRPTAGGPGSIVTYQARTGAVPAEAPAGKPRPGTVARPVAGEWRIEGADHVVVVADDCGPAPAPAPVKPTPRPRPARRPPR